MKKLKSILTTALVGTLGIAVIGFGVWAATSNANITVKTSIKTPTKGYYGVLNVSAEGCKDPETKTTKKVIAFDKDDYNNCLCELDTLEFVSDPETGGPMDIVIYFNMTIGIIGDEISEVPVNIMPGSGWTSGSEDCTFVYQNLFLLTFEAGNLTASLEDPEISAKATISYIGNGAVSENAITLEFKVEIGNS